MIFSDQTPIAFNDPLPASVDVVIIGGGVIGISTAWYLSQHGVTALVCEKGRVAGEQSSRNWGWIRQQGRDRAELPIVIDSINGWQMIASELDEDIGFCRHGVMYVAESERELAAYEKWLDIARQHQLDTRMLSSVEVDQLLHNKPGQWVGGIYTPSDGRAEPFKAVPAMARKLSSEDTGVHIREGCAVRSLDMQAGCVSGVVTEHGRVKTTSVVCAGGAWSSVFLANLGVVLPQLTVRSTVTRTAPAPDVYDGAAACAGVAIRRRADGGYTIAGGRTNEHFIGADSFRYLTKFMPALRASSKYLRLRFGGNLVERFTGARQWSEDDITPFERTRVLNPAPSPSALKLMRNNLERHFPQLGNPAFVESWAGMIDVTPDVVPVMDKIDAVPGLFLATGFSGHGFGIGPGAGRVMADLVLGNNPRHDLKRFRLSRFSDGSAMVPGPGL